MWYRAAPLISRRSLSRKPHFRSRHYRRAIAARCSPRLITNASYRLRTARCRTSPCHSLAAPHRSLLAAAVGLHVPLPYNRTRRCTCQLPTQIAASVLLAAAHRRAICLLRRAAVCSRPPLALTYRCRTTAHGAVLANYPRRLQLACCSRCLTLYSGSYMPPLSTCLHIAPALAASPW